MKNTILILICTLFTIKTSTAQSEVDVYVDDAIIIDLINIDSTTFYLTPSAINGIGPSNTPIELFDNQNELFGYRKGEFKETETGWNIVLWDYLDYDVPLSFINVLTYQNDQISSKYFNLINEDIYTIDALSHASNDSIYILHNQSGPNSLLLVNDSGEILKSKELSISSGINKMFYTKENRNIIVGNNNLYLIQNMEFIDSKEIDNIVEVQYDEINEEIYTLTLDKILIYDTELNLKRSINLSIGSLTPKSLSYNNERFYLLATNGDQSSFFSINSIDNIELLYEEKSEIIYTNIYKNDEYFIAYGHNSCTFSNSILKIGFEDIDFPISPSNLVIDQLVTNQLSTRIDTITENTGEQYFRIYDTFEWSVIVQNIGDQSIDNYKLISNKGGNYFMGNHFIYENHTTPLSPEESRLHEGQFETERLFMTQNLRLSISTDFYDIECSNNIAHAQLLTATENIENIDYKVYPNPTTGILYIENIENATYSLYNSTGVKVLLDSQNHDAEIDLSDLETGIYFLQVTHLNEIKTYKILKI